MLSQLQSSQEYQQRTNHLQDGPMQMEGLLRSQESQEVDLAQRSRVTQSVQKHIVRERASQEFIRNAPSLDKVNKMDEQKLIRWIKIMPESEYKQFSDEHMERSFSKGQLQSLLVELILINSMLKSELDLISEESSQHPQSSHRHSVQQFSARAHNGHALGLQAHNHEMHLPASRLSQYSLNFIDSAPKRSLARRSKSAPLQLPPIQDLNMIGGGVQKVRSAALQNQVPINQGTILSIEGQSESIVHLTLETISGADDVDETESKPLNLSTQKSLQKSVHDKRIEGTAYLAKNKVFLIVKPDILTQSNAKIEAVSIIKRNRSSQEPPQHVDPESNSKVRQIQTKQSKFSQ